MNKPLGFELAKSQRVQALIDELALEVSALSEKLTGLRGPIDEKSSEFLASGAQRVAEVRGRPLVYKYLGSGLGRGAYVELEDGSVKLDLINGIGVHILGHSHPVVVRASLRGGLSDVVQHGHLQMNRDYLDLSERLRTLAGKKSRLKHVWLTTSGSMANENALKMVRQKKSPARKIISVERAFAGRTTMMAEITDNASYKQGLPEYHEVLRIPFCNRGSGGLCATTCGKDRALSALKQHLDRHRGDIGAFVFEPVLGEGGYRVPCREFFIPLFEELKSEGIPIWADEVQTFLRTGEAFAFESLGFGSYVDVVTVAKTVQVGATLYTEEMNPQPGLIAGTFAGSAQALAAGAAILEELEGGGYFGPGGKIEGIHQAFVGGLRELQARSCKGLMDDIEGLGLMVAFTPLDGSKDRVGEFLKKLFDNGVITLGCGRDPYRARFLIPASITQTQIKESLEIIEKTLIECRSI